MFRTIVPIVKSENPIHYESKILALGSCFSENIGKKMQNAYFEVDINPFGVLFNPLSIHNSIQLLLEGNSFTQDDVFQNGTLWSSFQHSTLFSHPSQQDCLNGINARLRNGAEYIQEASVLLITFGTAWVYEEMKTGKVVSNCHKLPSTSFNRRLLSVEEIVSAYSKLLNILQITNPALRVIFSVSPIRHWKDGAHQNNISKSVLHLAIECLRKEFVTQLDYFPAYEILLDELRDYRFYSSDMFHPSEVAIDYIWQRFSESYFSEITIGIQKKLEKFSMQRAHRPLHGNTLEYSEFKIRMEEQRNRLIEDYPFLKNRMV